MTMATPRVRSGKPPLKVALCQIETETWDVEGNTDRTFAALEQAAEAGAMLAVTPECVIQGYPPHSGAKNQARLRELAQPLDGPLITRTIELSTRCAMDIVLGFAERDGTRTRNSCVYVSPAGVEAIYRKVHCRPFESALHDGIYTPGDSFTVITKTVGEEAYGVGMYICFDREIPESTRCMRALGAQLIVCPLATNTSRLDAPLSRADNEMLTRARAAENETYIAVVNHSGLYNGGSFVVGPSGECIIQMDERPGVVLADLDLGAVRSSFQGNPLGWAGWGFRRPGVYRPYLDPSMLTGATDESHEPSM